MAFAEGEILGGAAGGSGGGGDGAPGPQGPRGYAGWSPVTTVIADGARRVQKVVDWVGGGGTKPDVNVYVGAAASTYVSDIADAADFRGPAGAAGAASTVPGPPGPPGNDSTVPGPPGEPGTNGADGTKILTTSNAAPSNALGVNGDYAIDDVTHKVYRKAAGAWAVYTDLGAVRGPQAAGGPGNPPSVTGQEIIGDSWTNQSTWHVFVFNGTTWLDIGSIKGADGAPGDSPSYDIAFGFAGAVLGASVQLVESHTLSRACVLLAGWGDSAANLKSPNDGTVWTIKVADPSTDAETTLGTITWTATNNQGVFAFASGIAAGYALARHAVIKLYTDAKGSAGAIWGSGVICLQEA